MARWLGVAGLLGLSAGASAMAEAPPALAPVVTSPAPDQVALTVYRAANGKGALSLSYLNGFAMITETRQVRLPRGWAVLRFEGVADGIVPISAVIAGLPGGTIEKNRDARLLSPASLVDGTLGRQVTITRTDRATGRRVSEDATVVAGPSGGVVLQTAAGVEALRCAGLPEKLQFGGVPPGLSNKPVLSVTTDSPAAGTVTVRLTYLASGFDWRASYVATEAIDGRSLDLFAWLTLANANREAFPDAQVSAVAGRLNRVVTPRLEAAIASLRLACYPLGTTTSNLRAPQSAQGDIIVTARRREGFSVAMMAPSVPAPPPPPPPPPPEDLGDLKLYRVPQRVTVRSHGQKQVALLARTGVLFERRYRRVVRPEAWLQAASMTTVLVLRNNAQAGLGIALPAGSTALYARRPDETRQLLGLGNLSDRAPGETFRIAGGVSSQVLVDHQLDVSGDAVLRVTNANTFPVQVEIAIDRPGLPVEVRGEALPIMDGMKTWMPLVPPGGRAELRYGFKLP